MMQKVIILLFLAISFVMMTLISYMKFQTMLYLDSTHATTEYYMDNHSYTIAETKRVGVY